jgi:hypothetical protein
VSERYLRFASEAFVLRCNCTACFERATSKGPSFVTAQCALQCSFALSALPVGLQSSIRSVWTDPPRSPRTTVAHTAEYTFAKHVGLHSNPQLPTGHCAGKATQIDASAFRDHQFYHTLMSEGRLQLVCAAHRCAATQRNATQSNAMQCNAMQRHSMLRRAMLRPGAIVCVRCTRPCPTRLPLRPTPI